MPSDDDPGSEVRGSFSLVQPLKARGTGPTGWPLMPRSHRAASVLRSCCVRAAFGHRHRERFGKVKRPKTLAQYPRNNSEHYEESIGK